MSYTPLPYLREFLLELANNNYSIETVENYKRDLHFLEAFLWRENLQFESLDKLATSAFKGFLQSGEHVKAWLELRKEILANFDQEQLRKMGLEIHELSETGVSQANTEESGSKALKIDFKKKGGLSPRSINRMLSSLRNYLKFLIEIDRPVPIPPDAVKLIRAERKESQVAEIDDLINLIESPSKLETNPAVKLRNRAMLELLFSSGMRISELLNLNREQLTLYKSDEEKNSDAEKPGPMDAHSIPGNYVGGKLYIKGKGKKSRFVYLTQRARKYLEEYLATRNDNYPAVFIPYRGGRAGTKDPETVRISTNYLQERIVTYRRTLGIVVPTSAHSLRHGFATYLAEKGASPAAIQRLLGHESLQTTTRYVHASDKFAEDTHRQFHPLQEQP